MRCDKQPSTKVCSGIRKRQDEHWVKKKECAH